MLPEEVCVTHRHTYTHIHTHTVSDTHTHTHALHAHTVHVRMHTRVSAHTHTAAPHIRLTSILVSNPSRSCSSERKQRPLTPPESAWLWSRAESLAAAGELQRLRVGREGPHRAFMAAVGDALQQHEIVRVRATACVQYVYGMYIPVCIRYIYVCSMCTVGLCVAVGATAGLVCARFRVL